MSFIYGGNDENTVPQRHGGVQSSNAYANGSDPNCGNVITDRSTTRLHAPPGGHSQICFGADPRDAPQPVGRVSTQEHQDYRMNTVSNVTSQVFGVPSAAHAASSNAFANGSDQNNGNFITDRPTTRLHAPPGGHSQISFGTDNVFSAPVTSSRPNTAAAAAKEREQTGSDIFGAAPAPQQQQQQQEVVEEAPPPLHVAATEQTFKAMMIAELRTLCREHGISPAGSKTTLVERLCEAIASGEVAIMVANKGTSGVSKVGNNYGRAEGQNVGNFMTGRNSSRVLAPPGGGSTFSLGGYGSEAPPSPGNMSDAGAKAYKGHDIFANEPSVVQDLQGRMSDRKAAHLEGHDIFSNEPSAPEGYMSEIKAAHLEGHDVFSETRNAFVPSKQQSETMMQSLEGHDVFSETRNAFVPAKHQSDTKMQSDVRGHDVFGETAEPHRPGTAKSRAKAAEMSGQDIFSNVTLHGGGGAEGHGVFSNRRIVGGVTKPPGGVSSIIF